VEEKKYRKCRNCDRAVLSKLERCPYCGISKVVETETIEKQKSFLRKIFKR